MLTVGLAEAAPIITGLNRAHEIAWTNAFTNGACTIERAATILGPWSAQQTLFTTNPVGRAPIRGSRSR